VCSDKHMFLQFVFTCCLHLPWNCWLVLMADHCAEASVVSATPQHWPGRHECCHWECDGGRQHWPV